MEFWPWQLWASLLVSPTYNRVLEVSVREPTLSTSIANVGFAIIATEKLPPEQGIQALTVALSNLDLMMGSVGQSFKAEERQEIRDLLDASGFKDISWIVKV